MLLVRTIVKESSVHGLGLFADEPIRSGTRIWEFSPGLDLEITLQDFNALDPRERETILFYGFKSKKTNNYHLSFDDVRFINHDEEGNIVVDKSVDDVEYPLVANRDIEPGEELLQDYFEFDEGHRF